MALLFTIVPLQIDCIVFVVSGLNMYFIGQISVA